MEDQGKKQVDALKDLKRKQLKAVKDNKSDDNEKLLKYKNFFDELSNGSIYMKYKGEIYNMSKQIDFNNLICYFKDQNIAPINFISFKDPMHICSNIKNGNTSIKNRARSKII